MRTWLVLAMLWLSLVSSPSAQITQTPQATGSDRSASTTARVPVPEPSEKALAYHRSGNVLWVINTIWGLAIPALFLMTGFSARIRTWARALGRKWLFVIGVYFIIFSVISFVIDLPLSYYQGFLRQHAYGLSNQPFQKWATDQVTGLLVSLVIGVLFLWVPYLLLKKSPRRWWLYTGLAAVPFLVLIIFVQPIWIDPLFNRFGPMKDKALEAQILQLAERSGIEGSRVFEVAKSEDTKAINAYVNGVGGTKRIVLWDTILARLEPAQLMVVMGHEMGHFVLGHIWKSILIFSVLIMATLYAVHRVAGRLLDRYRERFGFSELSDVASLPLILLLFGAFSFLVTPVALAVTRHFEHEADRFALEITHGNYAAATAFVKLQQDNLAVPRPSMLYTLWRESHPPLGDRIEFCNDYRPWETGAPEVYAHLFKER